MFFCEPDLVPFNVLPNSNFFLRKMSCIKIEV